MALSPAPGQFPAVRAAHGKSDRRPAWSGPLSTHVVMSSSEQQTLSKKVEVVLRNLPHSETFERVSRPYTGREVAAKCSQYIAVGGDELNVYPVSDSVVSSPVRVPFPHDTEKVWSIEFHESEEGCLMLVGYYASLCVLYRVSSEECGSSVKELSRFNTSRPYRGTDGDHGYPYCVSFSGDGRLVTGGCSTVQLWDMGGKLLRHKKMPNSGCHVVWCGWESAPGANQPTSVQIAWEYHIYTWDLTSDTLTRGHPFEYPRKVDGPLQYTETKVKV